MVTETFEEYRLAAIRWIARGETTLHVLGLISSGKVRTTSDVVALDLERGWARTKSGSLYHLIAEGAGQPAPLHILAFCTTLHSWGLGGALGLPMIAPRRTDPAAPPGAAGRWLN